MLEGGGVGKSLLFVVVVGVGKSYLAAVHPLQLQSKWANRWQAGQGMCGLDVQDQGHALWCVAGGRARTWKGGV